MKKILYHGKRLDNGEWIEGFYYANGEGKVFILSCPRDFGFADAHEVDPATVGQYVGRTDKAGNKIFEGSVLRSALDTVVAIFYDEDYLQFRAREINPQVRETSTQPTGIPFHIPISHHVREKSLDYYDNGKMEIIGHISDPQWNVGLATAERKG